MALFVARNGAKTSRSLRRAIQIGPRSRRDRLASRDVLLNGRVLKARADGTIPEVEGVPHAGRVVRIAPLSAAFHVFPDARHAACFTQPQQAERTRELKREQAKAAKQAGGARSRGVRRGAARAG